MLRSDLSRILGTAIDALIASGELSVEARREVEISDTKSPEHGDFACNYALVATKFAGKPPRVIAELVRNAVLAAKPDLIQDIDIAGPGFLNIRVNPLALGQYVSTVCEQGKSFAQVHKANPRRINIEFVSVNPNGPITVGSARGAAFGMTLSNVLATAGDTVHREYYINDGVNSEQMRLFAESVRSYVEGLPFPERGYKGDYIQDVAAKLTDVPSDVDIHWYQSKSQDLMLQKQRTDLAAFRVLFDTWFSEQSLHESGDVARCIEQLEANGVADTQPYRRIIKFAKGGVVKEIIDEPQTANSVEDDEDGIGADPVTEAAPGVTPSLPSPLKGEGSKTPTFGGETLWLRSTKFGDDMDRVLRRRDGRLTYIASDVAYHKDKLNRPLDADKMITVLGPDHHGYIGRLTAVLAALLRDGTDTDENNARALAEAREKLEVLIFQIVRFVKDGKPAPMRKRDGNIYALIDLISEIGANMAPNATTQEQMEIGADVSRFFYLMRSHDSHMDFDIDLATKQSDENPVFYVQYAHARICSVLDKAAEAGFGAGRFVPSPDAVQLSREIALIKKVLDLPNEIERCAEDYGVHRLATYAVELARTYHHFYDVCRVIQADQPELSRSRMAICQAARFALQAVCDLIGVRTPERLERAETS